MDDLKKKGFRAFIWDFSGKLANQGVGLVVTIFLARLLEPAEFGVVAIVMVVVGIANIFSDIGLGASLIQRRRLHPVHFSSVFYFNVSVGLFLSMVIFFAAPWISRFYHNDQLLLLMQVMSVSFVLNAFSSVQKIRLRKELNYALLAKIAFVSSSLSGIIGVCLAFAGAGVWSLVVQMLSMNIIGNIILWRAARWHPSLLFSWKALTQLWAFGSRMFLVQLLDVIYTRMDYLIIGKIFDAATLGFYQRAKALNQMAASYTSDSLMSVLFPVLSTIKNDLQRFQKVILKSLHLLSFVTFFIYLILYLEAGELIVFIFGSQWVDSIQYFEILAIGAFVYPLNILMISVLPSRGNSKKHLQMAVIKKTLLFSNLYIGFQFGIFGFLYGLIFIRIINTYITIFVVAKEISLPQSVFIKPIVLQGIIGFLSLGGTLIFINEYDILNYVFLTKIIIFSVLYFLLSALIYRENLDIFYSEFNEHFQKIKKRFQG